MGVSLTKGGNVNLSKAAPGLTNVIVCLGWDPRSTDGAAFDLDSSVYGLLDTGKVPNDDWLVFYNNLTSPDGSVKHQGDNLTGAGDGDDEKIDVNLPGVSAEIDKLAIAVNVYDADARQQNFGMVRNAYARILNADTGEELTRYDLSEDYSTETSIVFGELYRNGGDWKFKAVGQGYSSGLKGLSGDYGVNV